jgi:hypothetical protein
MIDVLRQTPSASNGWPTASCTTTPEFLLPSTTGWSPGAGFTADSRRIASLAASAPMSFGVVPAVR